MTQKEDHFQVLIWSSTNTIEIQSQSVFDIVHSLHSGPFSVGHMTAPTEIQYHLLDELSALKIRSLKFPVY